MTDEARTRVFLSYSLADDLGRLLRVKLAESFEVTTPEMLIGSVARSSVLRQTLMRTDVAVVLLPPTDDFSWRNRLFEAGVAVGVGVPLVLVGMSSLAPIDLADSLVLERDQIEEIVTFIRELARSRRSLAAEVTHIYESDISYSIEDQTVTARTGPALSVEYADDWISKVMDVRSGHSAIRLFVDLFEHAGARVRGELQVSREGDIGKPDLVLWHDDLLASSGLPLPVEVLLRATSWPAVIPRLEQTLKASGARTLLAVTVRNGTHSKVWTDGRRIILLTPATLLARSLASMSLGETFGALLASADS